MKHGISYLPILLCTWHGIRGKHRLVGSGSISHDPYSASCVLFSSCSNISTIPLEHHTGFEAGKDGGKALVL